MLSNVCCTGRRVKPDNAENVIFTLEEKCKYLNKNLQKTRINRDLLKGKEATWKSRPWAKPRPLVHIARRTTGKGNSIKRQEMRVVCHFWPLRERRIQWMQLKPLKILTEKKKSKHDMNLWTRRNISFGPLSLHMLADDVSVHPVPLSVYSTLLMGPALRLALWARL